MKRLNAIIDFAPDAKVRVLLVGTNTARRMALGRIIREAGAEVVTVRTDEEALEYLLSARFSVLVTDSTAPDDECSLMKLWQDLPDAHRPSKIIPISVEHGVWLVAGEWDQSLPATGDVHSLLGALAGRMN